MECFIYTKSGLDVIRGGSGGEVFWEWAILDNQVRDFYGM